MVQTQSEVIFTDSRKLNNISSDYVDLVVTSPPYPMIKMWDKLFINMNFEIEKAFSEGDGKTAFDMMHMELDKVWNEIYRILKPAGIACINIGDATRTIDGDFRLYANHARITDYCHNLGFSVLPEILWQKQTNAPNKFMGSGMLPVGAYVTLEHEYIIILRKGQKKIFKTVPEKENRIESSFFWEERNVWFSDIWNFKGKKQSLNNTSLRERSAAYPFELAYRLINMYSVKGDVVLDPFLGTGTTLNAAIASCRNCIGVEMDESLLKYIKDEIPAVKDACNGYTAERLARHSNFVKEYLKNKKMKYINRHYNFPVMTKPESGLRLFFLNTVNYSNNKIYAEYNDSTDYQQFMNSSRSKLSF